MQFEIILLASHLIALRLVAVPTCLGRERALEVFGEPLFNFQLGLCFCVEVVSWLGLAHVRSSPTNTKAAYIPPYSMIRRRR